MERHAHICTRSNPTLPRSNRVRQRSVHRQAVRRWGETLAVGLFFGGWQVVVWTGWKPEYALPSPFTVLHQFWQDKSTLWEATQTTLLRAVRGYAIALVIGVVAGLIVSRSKVLRAGVGSMITGLQTMPSIAWFPAAIVCSAKDPSSSSFSGAVPDQRRRQHPARPVAGGRVLGAVAPRRPLPWSFIGGFAGWAFAWRSLPAELIVRGQGVPVAVNDYRQMYSVMMMIFIIGVVVDAVIFGTAERWIRRRYGLIDATES
jgi:NitT/TauT family transport system permease protein